MITRYCDGVVPTAGVLSPADAEIATIARRATERSWDAIGRLAIHEAIAEVWQLVDALNGYLTNEEPWALAKDPEQRDRLEAVLATAYRGLGTLAVLLSPVVPKASAKLWTALGAPGEVTAQRIDRADEAELGERVQPLEALFPRVEVAE
jgi:methionyl-tRNA synthetase